MPLPNLEDLCLRKQFRFNRPLLDASTSLDGNLCIQKKQIALKGSYADEVFLNNQRIDTITGNYQVFIGTWSVDSSVYTYLARLGSDWHAFTYSASHKKRICHRKLGSIYGSIYWGSASVKLLRMTSEGIVHGYAGCLPSYFTFHAWKPSRVISNQTKAFEDRYPQNIAESPDGKTFAALSDGELLLSADGYRWKPVARYDSQRISQLDEFHFLENNKSLTMLLSTRKGMEFWTLPLDRLSPKPSTLPVHKPKRPILL